MSACFDTLRLALKLPAEQQTDEIRELILDLVEDMHSANHRVNDAINLDLEVTRTARELAEAIDTINHGG